MIANEWKTINANVRAIEDRAIIVDFVPSPLEVHSMVGEWFDDQEVFDFVGEHLSLIQTPSARYYVKGAQLRQSRPDDWRSVLLAIMGVDDTTRLLVSIRNDPTLSTEEERAAKFSSLTGKVRSTYFRMKGRLSAPVAVPKTKLSGAGRLRLVGVGPGA